MGCTGVCFGPHVQFDIRINGRLIDPSSLRRLSVERIPGARTYQPFRLQAIAGRRNVGIYEQILRRSDR